jgi:tetratricopeptide (TPR) repeat protein
MSDSDPQKPATDSTRFLRDVSHHALGGAQFSGAVEILLSNWPQEKLLVLLQDQDGAVRRLAAMSLALVGDKFAVAPLAAALHDPDSSVHEAAEHALWGIWFRTGKGHSLCHIKSGIEHLNHNNFDAAIEKFSLAIEADPEFSEALNQRAIAHYLAERYEESIRDCRRVITMMPQHFGAMAGLGHCHAHLGKMTEAADYYEKALALNPRQECISQSLEKIRRHLGEAS